MADFRIEGEVTLDVSDISRGLLSVFDDLDRVDRQVNKLSRDLDKLDGKSVDIEVTLDNDTIEDFQMLKRSVEDLDGQTVSIDVDVDAGLAIAELEAVQDMVDDLDREKIDIPVEVDGFDSIASGAGKAQKAVGMGGAGGGGLIASLVLLGTTLIPIGVVAAGLTGGLVSSFATAGVGIGAFAAFAIPTIKGVITATEDLEKVSAKIKTAKTAKELNAALAAQKAILAGLSPEMLKAVKNLKDFKNTYKELSKELEKPTLKIFASSLEFATNFLKLLVDPAKAAALGIQELIDRANKGIKGDNWTKFFDYVTKNSALFIVQWGTAVGNFITGVANMIVAFDPLSKMVSGGLLEISENFLRWSQNLETNKGWQNFIEYVKENTPKAWAFIKELSGAIWDLLVILEPIGRQVMDFVTGILASVKAFKEANPAAYDMAVKIGLIAAAIAPFMGLIFGVVGGILRFGAALGKGVGALLKFSPALLAVAGPIGAVVFGITAIAAILALTNPKAREAGGLFDKLGEIWAQLKIFGGQILAVMKQMWTVLQNTGTLDAFTDGFNSLVDAFQKMLPVMKPVLALIGGALMIAIISLGYAFKGLGGIISGTATVISAIVKAIVKVFQWLYDVLIGHSIIPDLINGIMALFRSLAKFLTGNLSGIKSSIVGKWNEIGSSIKGKVTSIKNDITNFFNSAKTNASNAIAGAKNSISTSMENIRSIVASKGGQVLSWFRNLPGQIASAVGNLGSLLWNAGSNLIGGLLSGIQSKFGAVQSKLSQLTSMLPSWKGPETVDKELLKGPGETIIGGLIKGLLSGENELKRILNNITNMIGGAGISASIGVSTTNGATLAPAGGSGGSGPSSSIGMYVAPGAIVVQGGDSRTASTILNKLTRVARFGQFQGGTSNGV